jgi:hypothetical protein
MKKYGTDPKLPNYARPEYVALADDLQLIADEMGGTRAMHDRSNVYIRKWGGEKRENYNIRRRCETFFEGFGRTLSAGVGMAFAKQPQIEWNAAEGVMTPHWDNIDGAGANGPVFLKRYTDVALRDGLAIILVDHPSPPSVDPSPDNPEGEVTGDMEEALNLRPMWRRYERSQAINWMVEVVDNAATLTQLTLVEEVAVRDGTFGVKPVVRYRDMRLVEAPGGGRIAGWTLYERSDETGVVADEFRIVGSGGFTNRNGDPATRLPVAIAYTGRSNGIMDATIPLLGVAWANLSHWQLSTSLRFNTEVAGLAQPTVIGQLVGELEIGPLVSVTVKEGGDFKWTEPQGTGLERLAGLVLEKLRQIASLGVSFLQSDTRAAETAEAKRLDATAENATLATAITGVEDSVNAALAIHAWYEGIEGEGVPTIEMSRDFESTAMAPDVMVAYVRAIKDAGLPVRIMLDAWQQGGRIAADRDLEELEFEMMAQAEAVREAEEAEAKAAAERLADVDADKQGAAA